MNTTDKIMALADKYAFYVPGSALADATREALCAEIEALVWDAERLEAENAALRADVAHKDAYAGEVEKERDYWRQRAQTMFEHQRGEVWYWQGDGNDHPESMCNSLPVVIRADALRELLATPASSEQRVPLRGEEVFDVCRRTLPGTTARFSFVPDWAIPLAHAIIEAYETKNGINRG